MKQAQINNQDSTSSKSNNINGGGVNATTPSLKKNVQSNVETKNIETAFTQKDSIAIVRPTEKLLFNVPYRCTLNRDSLRAEMRKVVLEIDTIPKGIELIAVQHLTDTNQVATLKFSKSIFANHLLKTKSFEPKVKVIEQHNWMFLTILLPLLLIAILRVFYQKKFSLFINAFISKRFSNQIIREENALSQTTSVLLSVVFLISISLFFYLVTEHFHQSILGFNGFQKFSVIVILSFFFYILKMLTNKLGGYVFKVYKETDEYIFNQFLVLQILGLLFTMYCIILNYGANFDKSMVIYLGFGTMIIGFIVRMIKSIGIANMNTYSAVYIFLYLCTLEFLPLIIIVKLIMR